MTNHRKHSLDTQNKDISKKIDDPPVHATEDSLRRDVKRKREEMKKSTIGGF